MDTKANTVTFPKEGASTFQDIAFDAILDGDRQLISLEFDPANGSVATRDGLLGAISRFVPQLQGKPTIRCLPDKGVATGKVVIVEIVPNPASVDTLPKAYDQLIGAMGKKDAEIKAFSSDDMASLLLREPGSPADSGKSWAAQTTPGAETDGHKPLTDDHPAFTGGSGEHALGGIKDFKTLTVKVETHTPNKARPNVGVIVLRISDTAGHKAAPKPGEPTKADKIARMRELLAARPEFTILPDDAPEGTGLDRSDPIILIAPKTKSAKDTQSQVVTALKEIGATLDTGTGAHDILDQYMHRRR